MATKPVIQVKKLVKTFGKGENTVKVLNSVDLEVKPAEYIIIFGPSGCGKSTLLNCMAGLEEVTQGEIIVRGEKLDTNNEANLSNYRRDKIGMLFQQFNLLKTMSVLENVALPQLLKGSKKETRLNRAYHLLKLFDLEKLANRKPTELSGGQQQRVAMARALVNNPWILLIDEPTGNLDSKSAAEVMEMIKMLNKKSKRTIILVTHNPEYVYYPHRVIYMKDGQITKIVENKKEKFKEENVDIEDIDKLKELQG